MQEQSDDSGAFGKLLNQQRARRTEGGGGGGRRQTARLVAWTCSYKSLAQSRREERGILEANG